jgi:3-hydroxyisobutyrate dehydrogenase
MTAQNPGTLSLAFIGLGAMGSPMSARLVQSGFTVTGYDINDAAMAALRQVGGQMATTPAEAASNASVLIIIVASAQQVDDVLFGPNGALTTLPAGSAIMVCSTVPPSYMQALGQRLHDRGFPLLDAPVSGGLSGAADGTLTMMAAGSAAAFEACGPIMPVLASKIYPLGDAPGQGTTVKVLNQLLTGVHLATTTEAVALALRLGVDLERAYEVISNSAGASRVFTNRVPELLSGAETTGGALDIFVKDLGIVLDVGKEAHFPLPISASAHQLFLMGSAAGLGQEPANSLLKVFEKIAGIRMPMRSSSSTPNTDAS